MKHFLIAMESEAAPIFAAMENISFSTACGIKHATGKLLGEDVSVIVCGVGKVNAARGTQFAIDRGADVIINIGVAGGLNAGVELGGIYAIYAAVQYDFDLTQLNGTPIGTLNEFTENYIPLAHGGAFMQKRLATGDRFNDSKDDYNLLTEILGADIRDMEGAAIAQVCSHAGVPMFSYKIISDLAGSGSTTEQYVKNLDLCFKNLSLGLEKILKDCTA